MGDNHFIALGWRLAFFDPGTLKDAGKFCCFCLASWWTSRTSADGQVVSQVRVQGEGEEKSRHF
jgi:hypothetical protein